MNNEETISPEHLFEQQADWRPCFRRRTNLLLVAFIIWTVMLGIRGYGVMTTTAPDAVESGTVWKSYVLPAMRGRILDEAGIPLAWSEREFDLIYEKGPDLNEAWRDMFQIQDLLGLPADPLMARMQEDPRPTVVVRSNLGPEEIQRLSDLTRTQTRFQVTSRFIRYRCRADQRILRWIGETRQFGRREVGISGLERSLNHDLTGEDGRFRVLVDKNGRWIPGTWTQIRAPRAGFDRYVSFRLPTADVAEP